jgi:outer membrane murein-binding lipoprotein Lpp
MKKDRNLILLALLMVVTLLAGCVDKEKVDSIEETLKDIHITH